MKHAPLHRGGGCGEGPLFVGQYNKCLQPPIHPQLFVKLCVLSGQFLPDKDPVQNHVTENMAKTLTVTRVSHFTNQHALHHNDL